MQKKGFKLLVMIFSLIFQSTSLSFCQKIYDFVSLKLKSNSLARRNIKITKSLDIQTRLLGLSEEHMTK